MTSTPVQVDTELAELHAKANRLAQRVQLAQHRLDDFYSEKREFELGNAESELAEVEARIKELNALYTGWTRAFVVADGHVHSSMSCSTCFPTTRFGWLPQLSGADEAEIVRQAGEGACTVCYPSAPVTPGTRTLWHADDEARMAARTERDARKAVLAAKREANAITPVRTEYETIATIHSAKAYLTGVAEDRLYYGERSDKTIAEELAVALSLATKLGTSVVDELAAAAKRAANRK